MRRDVFQALADPNRRAIISLLATQTLTVKTLAEGLSITLTGSRTKPAGYKMTLKHSGHPAGPDGEGALQG